MDYDDLQQRIEDEATHDREMAAALVDEVARFAGEDEYPRADGA